MDGLIGPPGFFGPATDGPFGWLGVIPPLYSIVLVPSLAVWLPLLRKRVVLAWLLFAAATLLLVRDAIRFLGLPATDGYLALERVAFGATVWPWVAALALVIAFRVRGQAGPTTTGGRTLVVAVVFAPFLLALLVFALGPLFA